MLHLLDEFGTGPRTKARRCFRLKMTQYSVFISPVTHRIRTGRKGTYAGRKLDRANKPLTVRKLVSLSRCPA